MQGFTIFVEGADTIQQLRKVPIYFVPEEKYAARICEGMGQTEYAQLDFTFEQCTKSNLNKIPAWAEMIENARNGVYGDDVANISDMAERMHQFMSGHKRGDETPDAPDKPTMSSVFSYSSDQRVWRIIDSNGYQPAVNERGEPLDGGGVKTPIGADAMQRKINSERGADNEQGNRERGFYLTHIAPENLAAVRQANDRRVLKRLDWIRECQSWAEANLNERQHRIVDGAGESDCKLDMPDIELMFEDDWRSDRPKRNMKALFDRLKSAINRKAAEGLICPFVPHWHAKTGVFKLTPAEHISLSE